MLFLFLPAKIVQGEQESNFSPTFYFCLPHPKQHTRRADPSLRDTTPHQVYLVCIGDAMTHCTKSRQLTANSRGRSTFLGDGVHEFRTATRLQITITVYIRTHGRRKNHYEKIPLSIYIILVLYYRDKPYIITHPKTDRAKYL